VQLTRADYEEDAEVPSSDGASERAKSPEPKAEASPSKPRKQKPVSQDRDITDAPKPMPSPAGKKEASKRRPIEFPEEFVSKEPVEPAKGSGRSDDVSLSKHALPECECLDANTNCKGWGLSLGCAPLPPSFHQLFCFARQCDRSLLAAKSSHSAPVRSVEHANPKHWPRVMVEWGRSDVDGVLGVRNLFRFGCRCRGYLAV
jgi:hypothetical protein